MTEIEKILALSTGNMPSNAPDFGDYRFIHFEYGWIVWYSGYFEERGHTPEWLMPIMKAAKKHECTLILFDQDVLVDDEFEEYNW